MTCNNVPLLTYFLLKSYFPTAGPGRFHLTFTLVTPAINKHDLVKKVHVCFFKNCEVVQFKKKYRKKASFWIPFSPLVASFRKFFGDLFRQWSFPIQEGLSRSCEGIISQLEEIGKRMFSFVSRFGQSIVVRGVSRVRLSCRAMFCHSSPVV